MTELMVRLTLEGPQILDRPSTVNGALGLYPGFSRMRTTPFSVIGQLDQPVFELEAHHEWARS